jgi:hypothetical protein
LEELLLHRPEAQAIDLPKGTRPFQVSGRDRCFPFGPANSPAGLKQPQRQPWCPTSPLGDDGEDLFVNFPSQCSAPLQKNRGKFLVGVEIETEQEAHPVLLAVRVFASSQENCDNGAESQAGKWDEKENETSRL